MRPLKTWVLVADGAHARFLVLSDGRGKASVIPGQVFARHAPPSRDLGRDKPARVQESVGNTRHAVGGRKDLHEAEEKDFLRDVMRHAQEAFETGAFDKIIIVAPPRPLGWLREMAGPRLSASVLLTIDSDLVKHTDEVIAETVMARLKASELRPAKSG